MELRRLYFATTVGTEHKQIPFESPGGVTFRDVITEVAKKFGLSSEEIAISSEMGEGLTNTDLNSSVNDIVHKYGTAFLIINKGVVGN